MSSLPMGSFGPQDVFVYTNSKTISSYVLQLFLVDRKLACTDGTDLTVASFLSENILKLNNDCDNHIRFSLPDIKCFIAS